MFFDDPKTWLGGWANRQPSAVSLLSHFRVRLRDTGGSKKAEKEGNEKEGDEKEGGEKLPGSGQISFPPSRCLSASKSARKDDREVRKEGCARKGCDRKGCDRKLPHTAPLVWPPALRGTAVSNCWTIAKS